MKINSITANNHRRAFEIEVQRGRLSYPYALSAPAPTPDDPLLSVWIDSELADEAFTYTLSSGAEGTVHVDQVLEYNEDPEYLKELLLYRLSIEAQSRVESSGLAKREIIRRLGTSATQFYRLLDQTNTRKSLDSMVALLRVLGCDVDIVVRGRTA